MIDLTIDDIEQVVTDFRKGMSCEQCILLKGIICQKEKVGVYMCVGQNHYELKNRQDTGEDIW